MQNSSYKKYITEKKLMLKEIIEKIETNDILINELDDEILDKLICFYTKKIIRKKKKIKDIKDIIKKGQ